MAENRTPSAPAATPPEGNTTVDDKMVFEPQRLSYESADQIAREIAAEIAGLIQGQTVMIVDIHMLADIANLTASELELERLESEYNRIADGVEALQKRRAGPAIAAASLELGVQTLVGAATSAINPVTSLVTAGLGLVNLFRQDVEFHSADTKVDALTFEIVLGARVKAGGAAKVFLPDLVILPQPGNDPDSLRSRIQRLEQAKGRAWQAIAPLISELVQLDARLDQATVAKDQAQVDALTLEVASLRRDVQPVSDPISRADQRLADLSKQWGQVDETTGLTGLARLLRAEAVQGLKPMYLHGAVVSSGGHHCVVHNLWRTLFSGDGLSFMGGAVVRWALFEHDGSLTHGGMRVARRNLSSL